MSYWYVEFSHRVPTPMRRMERLGPSKTLSKRAAPVRTQDRAARGAWPGPPQPNIEDTGPGGIYSRLADIGHGPVRFTEDVSTRMPTPEEAEFLRLTPPQPAFFLVRVAFDDNDRPVETCEHIMSGDRWQLSYAWAADCLWCALEVSLPLSRPALRAAAFGGRPRAGNDTTATGELASPSPQVVPRQSPGAAGAEAAAMTTRS
jgi:hypothetical protein